jgi:GWxTD domain-containing protein
MEERERICDEAVLKRIREPRIYAQAILRVCEISVGSRLPCVAGIGRSRLSKRIEDIMMNRTGIKMGFGKKCMLALAALAAVAAPLASGIIATARHTELPPVTVSPISPHPGEGGVPQPQQAGQSVERRSTALFLWLDEDVVYIITPAERAVYQALRTDEERQAFVGQFWARRDPTPGTPANEFRDEHYRRFDDANRKFAARGVPGWKTDRGRFFIMWGPPDEIESHPEGGIYTRPGVGGQMSFPYEVWLYRYIQGTGRNVMLEFVDPSLTGNFVRAERR